MPNVFSPRDLVSRPDNMDETVPHTHYSRECLRLQPMRMAVTWIITPVLQKAEKHFSRD